LAIGAAIVALMMGSSAAPVQAATDADLGRGAGVNFPTRTSPWGASAEAGQPAKALTAFEASLQRRQPVAQLFRCGAGGKASQ